MSVVLTWLGHATWKIETGGKTILLDPFLSQSPTAAVQPADVDADLILVSHGHFDHVCDVAEIANRCDAMVVAIYEIAEWFAKNHDVKNTTGMNIGGSVRFPYMTAKMTPAVHSSQLPDGSYGGVAAGFLVTVENKNIYFACDTALFSDMKLIADVDVAVLPIGDLFTMGPEDSLTAIEWIRPKSVLPTHYNTWPPIEQNADQWADSVKAKTEATPVVLKPGESFVIDEH
ncbi:MAG: metal-dependent hydrolase [Planctomycetota bacterium]